MEKTAKYNAERAAYMRRWRSERADERNARRKAAELIAAEVNRRLSAMEGTIDALRETIRVFLIQKPESAWIPAGHRALTVPAVEMNDAQAAAAMPGWVTAPRPIGIGGKPLFPGPAAAGEDITAAREAMTGTGDE